MLDIIYVCADNSIIWNFFKCLYLFLRQSETAWTGEGQRRRHRIWSRLQALSCQHRVRGRARTHKLRDYDLSRSWMLNWLSHPGTPNVFLNLLFLRKRECEQGRSRGRRGQRIQSRLCADSREPMWGFEFMNGEMTWAKVRCSTSWATQVPLNVEILTCK